jgi:hypothetical protein
MEMKRPSLSLTNATTIAEREIYRLLSCAQKNAQGKEERGRGVILARKDSAIRHVAVGDWYYEWTPVGYLVEVTHRYGGPVNNNLDSDSNSA